MGKGIVTIQPHARAPIGVVNRLMIALLALGLILLALPAGGARAESGGTTVYFDGTGQTLGAPFFDAWVVQGGLERAGAPVSQVVQDGDRWTQWFEFSRLEVVKPSLDGATPEDVRPAKIGLAYATETGLLRWHPAFQPHRGAVGAKVRSFANGHTIANAFLMTYDRGEAGSLLGLPISQEFGVRGVTYQYFERGALSWTPDEGVRFVALGVLDAARHGTLRLTGDRPEGVPSYANGVIPSGGDGERWIDVNLSNYTLTAFEGNSPVFTAPLVDGAPLTPTARGTFYIYWKLDKQTMRGRNVDGSEYVTEDVPWVMYFYADFAIHGAYWRDSFGYSGSHGCVNLPVGSASWLYSWASYGTRVVVHD